MVVCPVKYIPSLSRSAFRRRGSKIFMVSCSQVSLAHCRKVGTRQRALRQACVYSIQHPMAPIRAEGPGPQRNLPSAKHPPTQGLKEGLMMWPDPSPLTRPIPSPDSDGRWTMMPLMSSGVLTGISSRLPFPDNQGTLTVNPRSRADIVAQWSKISFRLTVSDSTCLPFLYLELSRDDNLGFVPKSTSRLRCKVALTNRLPVLKPALAMTAHCNI